MSVNLPSIPVLPPVQASSSTYVGNYSGSSSANIIGSVTSSSQPSFGALLYQESSIAGIVGAATKIDPLLNPTTDRLISFGNQFESYFSIPSLATGLAPDFGLEQAKQLSGQSEPVAKFIEELITSEQLDELPDQSLLSSEILADENIALNTDQKTPVDLSNNKGRIRLPILLREPKIEELSPISTSENTQKQIAEPLESESLIPRTIGKVISGTASEEAVTQEQIAISEPISSSADSELDQTTSTKPHNDIIEVLLTLCLIQEEQLLQGPTADLRAQSLINIDLENQELKIQSSAPTTEIIRFNNLNDRLSSMQEIESEKGQLIESQLNSEIVTLATDTKTGAISATSTKDTSVQDTKLATPSSEQMSRNNPIGNDVLLHAQEDSLHKNPNLNKEKHEKEDNNLPSTKSTPLDNSKAQLEKASNEDLQSKSNDELVATYEVDESLGQNLQSESNSSGNTSSDLTDTTDQEQDSLANPKTNTVGKLLEVDEEEKNNIALASTISDFWSREDKSPSRGIEEKINREITTDASKHADNMIDLAGEIDTDKLAEQNEQGNNFSLDGFVAGSQLSSSAHSSSGNFDQGEDNQQEQLQLINEIKDYLNSQDDSMTVRLPNFEEKIRVKAEKGENIALELTVNSELDYQIIKEHLAGLVEHLSQKSGTNIEYFKVNVSLDKNQDGQQNQGQSGKRQYQGEQAWENLRRNAVVNLQTERNKESIWVA